MKLHLPSIFIAVLATACGAQDGTNKKDKADEQDDTTEDTNDDTTNEEADTAAVVGDEELAGEVVSAQIEESISALAEDAEAAEGGLSLDGLDKDATGKRFRECKVEDGKAIVDIVHSMSREQSFSGPIRSGSISMSFLRERHRTWSKEGGEMTCHESGKFVALDLKDMKGVALDVTLKGELSRSSSFSNSKTGKSFERSMSLSREGERHVKWLDVVADGDVLTISKEISFDVTRSLQAKKKDGTEVSISGSVKTDAEAPLLTEVKRDATSGAFSERLIKSGKLIASNKDGGRVETTFENVLYKAADGCLAVSGKTSGAIYAKDAVEPSVTFEINHGDNASVTFSDGRSYDYSPEGCEFDIDAVTPDDVASAEEAK